MPRQRDSKHDADGTLLLQDATCKKNIIVHETQTSTQAQTIDLQQSKNHRH